MSDTYVEERGGVTYVRGSRVPLESLVVPWREGHSAEDIREAYSTLTLAEVYGAVAFYLDHQTLIDQQIAAGVTRFEAQRQAAEAAEPARYAALRQRLVEARARRGAQSPAS
ncbi:MAG: DUF433 domain-containing protein [Ktedonobacterales bacterium]